MLKLKEYFSYKKFTEFPFRFLILDKSYHLQNQIIDSLKNMGHHVHRLNAKGNPAEIADNLLKACVHFKPDCIFGINHIGFDQDGKMAEIIWKLNIPVIFWYIDDYRFIIGENKSLVFPNVIIFCFEKNNIAQLKKIGFEHVYYLPTATGLNPAKKYNNMKYSTLSNAVSFVGSTFESTIDQWKKPGYEKIMKHIDLKDFVFNQNKSLVDYVVEHQSNFFNSKQDCYHYAGYVAANATQIHRKTYIKNLDCCNVHVFGDEKWKHFELNAQIHSPVDNINVAPGIFNSSAINLNISSSQLESAVNLRIFDVPAANGFLLTDWKESLADLFEIKNEIEFYQSIEEMNDKVNYYLNNPQKKEKIIENTKKRVNAEHLLKHRLSKIISIAQKTFS